MRWRVSHKTVGYGPLYQGRFKSFPIERDDGLEMVLRYVERNALSADMVKRAQDWRYGSLFVREQGTAEQRAVLTEWPIERSANWKQRVNKPLTDRELDRMRTSIQRDRPLGSPGWTEKIVARLGLQSTIRERGRQRKAS
jgi:putative transposase